MNTSGVSLMSCFFLFKCCGREACSKGGTNSSLLLAFHRPLVVALARYRCCSSSCGLWPIRRFAAASASASTFPEFVVLVAVAVIVATVVATTLAASSAATTSLAASGALLTVSLSLETIFVYLISERFTAPAATVRTIVSPTATSVVVVAATVVAATIAFVAGPLLLGLLCDWLFARLLRFFLNIFSRDRVLGRVFRSSLSLGFGGSVNCIFVCLHILSGRLLSCRNISVGSCLHNHFLHGLSNGLSNHLNLGGNDFFR